MFWGPDCDQKDKKPIFRKKYPHLATKTPVVAGEFFNKWSGSTYLTALYCIVLYDSWLLCNKDIKGRVSGHLASESNVAPSMSSPACTWPKWHISMWKIVAVCRWETRNLWEACLKADMSCQFHQTHLPAWVDEWLVKNNGSATIIVTLTEVDRAKDVIYSCIYVFKNLLLCLLWVLNLTISTIFPYLVGVVGGQFS